MIEEARKAFPKECCGLLLGRFGRIQTALPRNVHDKPERFFEIDPQALIDAHRAERSGGPSLIGYYHSHPNGEPYPSPTDRESAAGDGRIWAIIGSAGVMFWEDYRSGFVAQTWDIVDERRSPGRLAWNSPLARVRRWKS